MTDSTSANLKGAAVAVTGAGGFIGSHLVELLVRDGYRVRALCSYQKWRPQGWLSKSPVRSEVEFVYGDVRSPEIASQLVAGVEVVFHLAARISIPQSYIEPQTYVDVNVGGTLNMLRAAIDADVVSFVQTSTSEVYGTAQSVPITESHPITPQSPYAASKVASDALAYSYHRSYGLDVSIVRPFNVFGPRQSVRAVTPSIILQVLAGKGSIELGNLEPTRDLNFVLDTVRAVKNVGFTPGCAGKTLNIASGREVSIGELATKILEMMDSDAIIEVTGQRLRPDSSEVYRLVGSPAAYEEAVGSHKAQSLKAGLAETIQWFRSEYPNPELALQALTDPDLPSRLPHKTK